MAFSLKRVFHNIRRHAGVYLIFIVGFAIGTAVLACSLNVQLSLNSDLKAEREKMLGEKIGVMVFTKGAVNSSPKSIPELWEDGIDISYDTYLSLEKMYGDDLNLIFFTYNNFEQFISSRDENGNYFFRGRFVRQSAVCERSFF